MSDDFRPTEDLLKANRPTLDEDRLDQLRRRVETRPARRAPSVLVVALLTLGFAFSAGGTGLAVSGLASDTTAVQAQYPPTTTPGGTTTQAVPSLDGGAVQGETETVGGGGSGGSGGGDDDSGDPAGDVAGEQAEVAPGDEGREVAAVTDEDELPFTGWAALPIMLLGLAMLTAGLVLRRRTNGGLAS
jgi:hypothetical protein